MQHAERDRDPAARRICPAAPWWRNHLNDWEPRGGIAWAPLNKFVFRAGAGMFHGRDAISQTSALGQLPPNDRTATLNNVTFSQLAPFNPDTPQPPTLLGSLDPIYFNPLSYQYSAGVQYQAGAKRRAGSQLRRQPSDSPGPQPGHQPDRCFGVCWARTRATLNPDLYRPYLGYSDILRKWARRHHTLQLFAGVRQPALHLGL